MEQYALSNEEKANLKKYGSEFLKWRETSIGKNEIQEHRDHEKYFKLKLAPENLSKITKSELIEIYKQLWASKFWSNKDWKINKILNENNLDNLKKELHQLLYDNEIFEKRYDSFRTKIKGFGISTISEILNMVFPEKFCLWNNVTKTALNFLKLKDNLSESVFKYNYISGEEYSQCLRHVSTIKNELSVYGVNDFVELDMFLWYIHEDIVPKNWKRDTKLEYDKEEQNELQEKKNDIIDLENLILEYDKNKDILGKRKITEKEAMQLRSEFISDFPSDKILDIKIDNYVEGKKLQDTDEPNRKTFCYRLEFGLPGFGSLGGVNAIKFGIYYSPKDKKYVYSEKKFHSAEEAYQKILTQIDTLLKTGKQFTQDNDWKKLSYAFERVDEIKSIVKSKILAVYFPDAIVSINSHNGIKQILKSLFHIPDEEIQDEFMLNKEKLWEIKQNHPIMKNWSNFDYSTFVWRVWKKYFDSSNNLLSFEEKLDDINQLKTGYWVIRAGSKGEEEQNILENNIVTIGWGAGDLSRFNDKESIKIEFAKLNPTYKKKSTAMISSELWKFAKEIKKGDVILLPQLAKGSNHNIAIAQVTDDYRYREDLSGIENTRPVTWLHKNIPINEFREDVKESFSIPLTVYRIHKPSVIQSIIDTMQKYNILPKEVQELQIEGTKSIEPPIEDKSYILTLESLSEILFMPFEKLKAIEELLEEKKQIIFYGPPGTSKTFVAKKFSEYFVKNKKENMEIVQFHPSYSYEDFIEGIKPRLSLEGEALGFVKQPGIFKNLVDKCIKNPDKRFVLIVDEVNRGNISKIFGELIYLLEYRKEKIHLTYSPTEEFYIPDNLYIIGTMNSADRSIAFVDYALRRRFFFIEFYPDTDNESILKKWFKENMIKEQYVNNILNIIKEINFEISRKLGKEYQIGYSYFMIKNLDNRKLQRVIDYAIIPLVEQYFFGKKDNVDEIRGICNRYINNLNNMLIEQKQNDFSQYSPLESNSITSPKPLKEDNPNDESI